MRAGVIPMVLVLSLVSAPAVAQTAGGGAPGSTAPAREPSAIATTPSADEIRDELVSLLRLHPPALHEVLRLSPALATNVDYLQPYPELAAFFAAHPEVLRNPSYYLGAARSPNADSPGVQRVRAVEDILESGFAFLGVMSLLGVVAWILRSLMDHQRWKRALRVQADMHAKVLERLSATEDVLTYTQTPAGRHFLESGAPLAPATPALAAPVNRILWSVHMGTVIVVLGIGILVCVGGIDGNGEMADVKSLLAMLGAVGLSIGVGFLISAAVSYRLSRRLGLLTATEPQHG